jgi:hypothetical protein
MLDMTRKTTRGRLRGDERGMSLLVMMIMMLLSALMIGFMMSIMADARNSGIDRDETQAYAAAHAGMEKLTSDLARLFLTDYSPNGTQITATASVPPAIAGFNYTDPDGSGGYKIQYTTQVGGVNTLVQTPSTAVPYPDDPTTGTTIAAGPYQGFKGLVTHYNIMVTARTNVPCVGTASDPNYQACLALHPAAEIRMRRELQTVAVPVFQFGLFSESSLSFHAGNDFNFGGRIHTNGNLFLTSGGGHTLTLSDKVTAFGEIVRKYLDNGILATSQWNGTVKMASGTNTFVNLLDTQGSVISGLPGGVGPCLSTSSPACLNEPTWTNLSIGTYNGYIRNGRTGAKRLDLPLVSFGAQPIDLIRRPNPPVGGVTEDNSAPLVYAQRFYTQAALRILLSDTAADLTGLPGVTATAPINLEPAVNVAYGPAGKQAWLATSLGTCPTTPTTGCYKSSAGTPLIGGRIKIELQKTDNTWQDVTTEILNYGIAGRNISNGTLNTAWPTTSARNGTLTSCLANEPQPNAIIRLERVKDVPSSDAIVASQYDCLYSSTGVPYALSSGTDYWPLALYDTREAFKRNEGGNDDAAMVIGGVMYYVELDTNNLAKWLMHTAPYTAGSGNLARNDNNGYIIYFSDRRNNRNTASAETGEFGNEDIINPATAAGTANGSLDAGEDVNATTLAGYTSVLDTYGTLPNYAGVSGNAPPGNAAPLGTSARVNDVLPSSGSPYIPNPSPAINAATMRANRPLFFRRALKLTHGSALAATGITGLTIASENPVYVEGNYNSSATNTPTESHIAAAIIADTIIVLSNAWNDLNSLYSKPNNPAQNQISGNSVMAAVDSGYRFAAVSGKTISFPRPTTWTPTDNDFGDDGGAHNLLHLLERWDGQTMFYRGSLVSFYISRQATGIYKAGPYGVPDTRTFNFDTDFLLPNKLPPGTPMFRDVNTLTFRQLLRPNQ